MTQNEFEALIEDESKVIQGDISWVEDEDHSPAVEFIAEVSSTPGYPLFIKATYNAYANTLSYGMIHRGVGRIYGLDLGKDHRNPDGRYVGEKHKHRWNEPFRDKEAYVPQDITAPASHPVEVWQQFCIEAKISHIGQLRTPPPPQMELL